MQWPSQSPDLDPIEHAFHLLKTKLKGKFPKNKQELKTFAVEIAVETVIDCKGFATKY